VRYSPLPGRMTTGRPLAAALVAALLATLFAAPFGFGAPRDTARAVSAASGAPASGVAGRRVGLQIGHLRIAELPEDQARLRGQTGGSGGGVREVDINIAVVERATLLLQAQGVVVDVLPATVPRGYRADAFVAVHCDANPTGDPTTRGYKLARYRESLIPEQDDALIAAISTVYGPATGLPLDPNVTRAMTGYYAYNPKRYQTIIDRGTPSTIVELGYLTNPLDRALLVTRQDLIAAALAEGILRFLGATAPLAAPVSAPTTQPTPAPPQPPAPPPAQPVQSAPTPTATPVPHPATRTPPGDLQHSRLRELGER
jgi:hypothetical protein